MAEGKKSVVLYADLIHTVKELTDEEAGKLFKHYLSYINDLNPEAPDRLTAITFEPIKQQLKRDLKSWKESIESKSLSGRIGNLKRWAPDLYAQFIKKELSIEEAEKIAQDRNSSHSDNLDRTPTETVAKVAVNDNVTVNVNDTVIKKEDLVAKAPTVSTIIQRKDKFKTELEPFLKIYGKDLLNDFFKYWTNSPEGVKKMPFEKEKSFVMELRLKTWSRNNDKYQANPATNTSGNVTSFNKFKD